jgi:hypothetical protein
MTRAINWLAQRLPAFKKKNYRRVQPLYEWLKVWETEFALHVMEEK